MPLQTYGKTMSTMTERLFLLVILAAYLVVGALFALYTPDWQAPDEPAHYNYVAQVAAGDGFPMIEPGDWQQAYQEALKAARFAPELLDELGSIEYEDHQPPLYYLLASVVYRLTAGSLQALRLLGVVIGAGVVLCAYAIGKLLYPQRAAVGLGAAAFVAFLPQHVAMLAAVNNDSLSELLIGLTLLVTLLYLFAYPPLTSQYRGEVLLGVLLGLIFITKSTGYLMAGVVVLALLLRWRRSGQPAGALIRVVVVALLPALILGGLWWARNIAVYGFPDFLGLRAHDVVVADQLRTADYIASIGFNAYLSSAVQTTFNSFWGQFGWMALPLPEWMYMGFAGLLVVALSGLLLRRFLPLSPSPTESEVKHRRDAWLCIGLLLLLALLAYVYYNTEFVQFQGRYLFPALIPLGLLVALGLDAWPRWLLPRVALAQWAVPALLLLLAPLDVYIILRLVAPLLTPA